MSDENKSETRPIEHTLPAIWQGHIKEVLIQLQSAEGQIAQAKVMIFDRSQDVVMMRNHLAVLVGQLAKAELLPEPVAGYRLSPDGTKILGEIRTEDQEG